MCIGLEDSGFMRKLCLRDGVGALNFFLHVAAWPFGSPGCITYANFVRTNYLNPTKYLDISYSLHASALSIPYHDKLRSSRTIFTEFAVIAPETGCRTKTLKVAPANGKGT